MNPDEEAGANVIALLDKLVVIRGAMEQAAGTNA